MKAAHARWLRAALERQRALAAVALSLGLTALRRSASFSAESCSRAFARATSSSASRRFPERRSTRCCASGGGCRAICWRCRASRPWSSRSAARSRARTRGARTGASCTSSCAAAATSTKTAPRRSVRKVLAATPGIESEVMTFLADRLAESLTGDRASVSVRIVGDDLQAIDRFAEEVAAALRTVPGAVDVTPGERATSPHLGIALRADAPARHGFRSAEALAQVEAAVTGVTVARVPRAAQSLAVVVRLAGPAPKDPASVGGILVRSATSGTVALGDLADIRVRDKRDVVLHEGGAPDGDRRAATSTAPDESSFNKVAAERCGALPLPPGVPCHDQGHRRGAPARTPERSRYRPALGALDILALLARVAGSGRSLALMLAVVPLGLLGRILAVAIAAWLHGSPAVLSLGSLIGFRRGVRESRRGRRHDRWSRTLPHVGSKRRGVPWNARDRDRRRDRAGDPDPDHGPRRRVSASCRSCSPRTARAARIEQADGDHDPRSARDLDRARTSSVCRCSSFGYRQFAGPRSDPGARPYCRLGA